MARPLTLLVAGLFLLGLLYAVASSCKAAPQKPGAGVSAGTDLETLLAREAGPLDLLQIQGRQAEPEAASARLRATASPWEILPPSGELRPFATSMPLSFKYPTLPATGCVGSGVALVVSEVKVGQKWYVTCQWPVYPGVRYLILSSKPAPEPLAGQEGCVLAGSSEWVFPVPPGGSSILELPGPSQSLAGTAWVLQPLQVDLEDGRVRMGAGYWVRVGR